MSAFFRGSNPPILIAISCCMVILIGSACATTAKHVSSRELADRIAELRMESTAQARTDAAGRITALLHGGNVKDVDATTLADLVSLLGEPESGVRFWTILALKPFGKRAAFAAPKIIAILPEFECTGQRSGPSPEFEVRVALVKLGVKPPPEPDCSLRSGTTRGA